MSKKLDRYEMEQDCCAKCGHNHRSGFAYRWREIRYVPEWDQLLIECQRCGYAWREPAHDSAQAKSVRSFEQELMEQ